MFENSYKLSAFIKFENQPIIRQLESKNNMLYSTGYFDNKKNFLEKIEQLLDEKYIPADIKNNHYILNHILTKVTKIRTNFNAFYCLFPIEVDKHELDPKKLYEQQNPESVKTITDVDLVIAIFNKTKFEFYLIEGKDSGHLKSQVNEDFFTKIKPNLKFPNSLPEIKYVREPKGKGGYVCYRN